jgi:hypothetical protein
MYLVKPMTDKAPAAKAMANAARYAKGELVGIKVFFLPGG